jgi:3,4-dihydroxy 2-butanone 4-phosphate synthase / GTP cyclohydrolase II
MPDFTSIEAALDALRAGRMILVVDDPSDNTEGNVVMAAELVRSEDIAFIQRECGGTIAVAGTAERFETLDLDLVGLRTNTLRNRNFGIAIDAREGTTSGASATDKARTVRLFADPSTMADDFARPGHITTLKALDGGVLSRAGHTEASVDLTRLAGMKPAALLAPVLTHDGAEASLTYLLEFAGLHDLPVVSIRDLIAWRGKSDKLVEEIANVDFPSCHGTFVLRLYESDIDDHHHLAIIKGDVRGSEPVLVRVHSECLTGDVLGSLRCDCGDQLAHALRKIEEEGRGVVVYMRQEGRGIGLANKIKAYMLQDGGMDTVEANIQLGFPADLRDYGIGAQILADLGIKKIRLMTNNPTKVVGLEGYGLEIVERVPIEVEVNCSNAFYMQTKKDKMGHLLSFRNGHTDDTEPDTTP